MPWGRIDDGFWEHPKVLSLKPELALRSVGLFWLADSWSNKRGTDGLVPFGALRILGATSEEADELVRVGLWEREGDAFRIHDFLVFNKSKAQVEADKAQRADAGRAGAAARWHSDGEPPNEPPNEPLDGTNAPVTRIPVLLTPTTTNPPRADDMENDPANVYWNLAGRFPTGRAMSWIDSLIDQYGSDATTKAMVAAFMADKTVNALLGNTRDILAAEARRLDIKEREAERERVREKRAKPQQLDPMEQAFRDALLKRYADQAA